MLTAMFEAFLVISSAPLYLVSKLLSIISKCIFFILFTHIVFGIEFHLFPLFQHLEIFSRVLDDVIGLISEDLPG